MKKIAVILFLLFVSGVFYIFWQYNIIPLPNIEKMLEIPISAEISLKEVSKNISTPPPLRADKESPKSFLAKSGIITWTNIQRNAQGLMPLSENENLNNAAALKAGDMLEKQYFDHVSPSGVDVGDLAEAVGYKFITIGENLALGNFESDKILVQAWMDSPGHRENILGSRFTEIGVAAVKGIFEGEPTWIAVQEFGLPLSACPDPDKLLRMRIESNTIQLQEIENGLKTKQREMNSMRPKWGGKYNKKVDEYNALVLQYNNLHETTEFMTAKYNNQIKKFNACVSR